MLYLVFHLFICQLVLTTGFQFSLVLNVFREKMIIVGDGKRSISVCVSDLQFTHETDLGRKQQPVSFLDQSRVQTVSFLDQSCVYLFLH